MGVIEAYEKISDMFEDVHTRWSKYKNCPSYIVGKKDVLECVLTILEEECPEVKAFEKAFESESNSKANAKKKFVNYNDYANAPSIREGIENGLIKPLVYSFRSVTCEGQTFHVGDWVIVQGWGNKGFMRTVAGRIEWIEPCAMGGAVSWSFMVKAPGGFCRVWEFTKVYRMILWKEKEKEWNS